VRERSMTAVSKVASVTSMVISDGSQRPPAARYGGMADYDVQRGTVTLGVSDAGSGPPVVLAHGLTATRRYVVMGSTALERGGHRVIAYDARGHGASSPAESPEAYRYEDLGADLEAVLDHAEVERAVLAGASMGAHTLAWLALHRPERVAGLVLITPAFIPGPEDPGRLARWDALSDGLRRDGIDGFVAAYGEPRVPERWRETVIKVIRQRLALHHHPDAVADALRAVPRSRPFAALPDLESIAVPTAVVASADEADPEHPQAVGEAYAETIPGARLVTDEPGESPVAWQGSQLSKVIAEVVERARL
jgi:pimeloyl-ACP methyl ester carboxylesterase